MSVSWISHLYCSFIIFHLYSSELQQEIQVHANSGLVAGQEMPSHDSSLSEVDVAPSCDKENTRG
jgi:hypothetical protein